MIQESDHWIDIDLRWVALSSSNGEDDNKDDEWWESKSSKDDSQRNDNDHEKYNYYVFNDHKKGNKHSHRAGSLLDSGVIKVV